MTENLPENATPQSNILFFHQPFMPARCTVIKKDKEGGFYLKRTDFHASRS